MVLVIAADEYAPRFQRVGPGAALPHFRHLGVSDHQAERPVGGTEFPVIMASPAALPA